MTSANGVALLGWLLHENPDGPLPLHAQVSNHCWWKQNSEQHAKDANTSMEFVLRLVLGPYVAIVMVCQVV
jgi:hypothetical protein